MSLLAVGGPQTLSQAGAHDTGRRRFRGGRRAPALVVLNGVAFWYHSSLIGGALIFATSLWVLKAWQKGWHRAAGVAAPG